MNLIEDRHISWQALCMILKLVTGITAVMETFQNSGGI